MIDNPTYRWTAGQAAMLYSDLVEARTVHTGEWQAMDTTASKAHATHELEDVTIIVDQLPDTDMAETFFLSADDQSWAEEHLAERVSGTPYNPAPSHVRWPYAVGGNARHTDDLGKFDHTYPERMWPVMANVGETRDNGRQVFVPHNGIRFEYGDLNNVVDLLVKRPGTRQAYLPIWFPEDTWAAANGKRVPCTLGYHFMIRDNRLTTRYYMRSCDAVRHLRNDLYLAGMLARWVVDAVNSTVIIQETHLDGLRKRRLELGGLVMHISSLHSFVNEDREMRRLIKSFRR